MLFEKLINREVERRMHEENLRQEMWKRLDKMQNQIEELQFKVACVKSINACVKNGGDTNG